jgi:hypothetical protein
VLQHRRPIFDGGAHIAENPQDARFDLPQRLGRRLLVHLNLHEGFARGAVAAFMAFGDLNKAAGFVAFDLENWVDHKVHG